MSIIQLNALAHPVSPENLDVGSGHHEGRFARGLVVAYLICLPIWPLAIYAACHL